MAPKKTRTAPARARLQIARAKRLGLGSALAELQSNFQTKESRDFFGEWRRHPVSMMLVDALRELAMEPPAAYVDTDSIPVQYGVSSGLGLAASILDDPSVLYPHLFTGVAPGAQALPEADYEEDPLAAGSRGES